VNETANHSNKHPDEITLLLYVERQLDRDRAQEVSRHTQTCERCLILLRALDRESRLLTRSMLEEDEPLPARLAEFHAKVKRSMQWIWGVVFAMALLGVYLLYAGYVEPWQRQFEQAGFDGTNLLSLFFFQSAFWKGWQSMFSLVEIVGMASFAGFGLFLVRRYLKRGSALAVVFASMGLLMATANPATATEFRKSESVQIHKDEVINSDLFAMGDQIKMNGTVDGDFFGFGQDVEVSGHVTGDVICFCRSLRVNGQVDGNVRDASNNVTILGSVGRNVTTFSDMATLEGAGKIGHTLMAFSNNLVLDGSVGRDFLGFFGNATVDGSIAGELRGKGRSLSIGSGASIGGKATFEGDKTPEVSSTAKLASPLQYTKMQHHSQLDRGVGYYIWRIIWAGAWILLGLVLISVMPRFSVETVEAGERYGAALGLGVLVFFGVGIAAIIACVTIVGLLLGISTFFLWIVSLFASYVVAGAVVGRWILGKVNEHWPLVGRMVLGVIIVVVCTGLPYIGGWICFAVWIWGMGAIALAVYRRVQPIIAPNIPSMPGGPVGTPLPPTTTVSPA
jgi:cytoskeletal protein CcmA (bactofilin family)